MVRNSLKNIARLIQSVQKIVPAEQSFLADLKRSIEIQNKKTARLPSRTYKPSSMHCIRGMYYQIIGVPVDDSDTPYTLIGICNSGTDIHSRIQQSVIDMKSNGIECEYVNVADFVRSRGLTDLEIVKEPDFTSSDYETKLYHKAYNISFLCDGIIRYKGQYYILEIKTESSNKFMMRKGVDKKHYHQGTCYSLMFGLDRVIFVYINRDVLDMKSYMFEPTMELKQEIIETIHKCNSFVDLKIAPPKPDNIDISICRYCPYKQQCENEVKWEAEQ